jgi:hypothetical protein
MKGLRGHAGIGETVYVRPAISRNVPGGAYVVTKQLPHNGREFEYRTKSANEEHERVVRESELTSRPFLPAQASCRNPGTRPELRLPPSQLERE